MSAALRAGGRPGEPPPNEIAVSEPVERAPSPGRRAVGIVVALAIVAGMVFVGLTFAGGFSATWAAVRDMSRSWLVVALGCEVVAYGFLALHVRRAVGAGHHAKRAAPVRTALVLFGLGRVLPAAPLESFAMAGAALKRRRLDRRRMTLLFGFTQWFSVQAILTLAAVAIVIAVALSHVPGRYETRALLAASVTLAFLFVTNWLSVQRQSAEVVGVVLLRLRHWRSPPDADEGRAKAAEWHVAAMRVAGRRTDRLLLRATTVGAWVADGLCLYFALRATGTTVGLDVLFLAYSIGVLTSLVPLLPAGIGLVETVTPLILHVYGVPLATALAAVLAYRLLATVLPAVLGLVALAGLRVGPKPS
jgi:uncharacterized protein (TIRG00374 family)